MADGDWCVFCLGVGKPKGCHICGRIKKKVKVKKKRKTDLELNKEAGEKDRQDMLEHVAFHRETRGLRSTGVESLDTEAADVDGSKYKPPTKRSRR